MPEYVTKHQLHHRLARENREREAQEQRIAEIEAQLAPREQQAPPPSQYPAMAAVSVRVRELPGAPLCGLTYPVILVAGVKEIKRGQWFVWAVHTSVQARERYGGRVISSPSLVLHDDSDKTLRVNALTRHGAYRKMKARLEALCDSSVCVRLPGGYYEVQGNLGDLARLLLEDMMKHKPPQPVPVAR